MRLFVAYRLPGDYTLKFSSTLAGLAKQHRGTYVLPQDLHVTFAFLGEVPEAVVPRLIVALRRSVRAVPRFKLKIRSLVALPHTRPHILALAIKPMPEVNLLQQQLLLVAARFKIQAQTKAPHVTLCRLKQAASLSVPQISLPTSDFLLTEIQLIKSTLTTANPNYETVAQFPLALAGQVNLLRQNVAMCLLNSHMEVLLVHHREHSAGAWQLPQGGIQAQESIESAALRELKEELGMAGAKIVSVLPKVYQYHWPRRLLLHGTDTDKQGFLGQEQSLAILKVNERRPKLVADPREAQEVRWIPMNEFSRTLSPVRRKFATIVMKELERLGLLKQTVLTQKHS